ncbi:MAG: methionine synthase, partial [Desulfobacterales bacterium]|nr:methionine synthase [Desulfobacterales bacterium]
MPGKTFDFHYIATGIGSVPFEDIGATCRYIFDRFPSMPFWPQFVRRSYVEDMSAQYCEGLPLLEIREQERSIVISSGVDAESELTRFYEHFLCQDLDYFSISREYAPG